MIFRVNRVDTNKEVNLNLVQIAFFEDGSVSGTTDVTLINGIKLTVQTTPRKVRTQFRRMNNAAADQQEQEESEAPVVTSENEVAQDAPEAAPEPVYAEEAAPVANTDYGTPPEAPTPAEYVGYNEPA